jgi:chorismate synthase
MALRRLYAAAGRTEIAQHAKEDGAPEIYGRIKAIGGLEDTISLTGRLDLDKAKEELKAISEKSFAAALDVEAAFRERIAEAKAAGDSVGGVVEVAAFGLPAGLGEPFFGSVESRISELLFSVPAVKGVEFGDGFALAGMAGGVANDAIRADSAGQLYSETNRAGGILGGITNGMPLVFRAAFKPTPSIAAPQLSVDPLTMRNCELRIKGRHDPCIVPRAVVVCEACAAIALLDLAYEGKHD